MRLNARTRRILIRYVGSLDINFYRSEVFEENMQPSNEQRVKNRPEIELIGFYVTHAERSTFDERRRQTLAIIDELN